MIGELPDNKPGKGLENFFQFSAGIFNSFSAAEGPEDLPAQPHLIFLFLFWGRKFISVVLALALLLLAAKSVTFPPGLVTGFPHNFVVK